MKVLQVQNIHYGNILNGVNFDWNQGEIIALMGANGSGKSTLARILNGLLEPKEGEIRLTFDETVCDWNTVKRWQEIGLVGQHPRRQTIGATVAEELGFGLLNLGWDRQSVVNRVLELAASVGLKGKEDQSPATLSGGERQRLVTAAILALQPSFLILDESLTMLDMHSQANVLKLLFKVQAQTGQLWITHDPELARQADRLLVIKNGKISDLGNPSDALDNGEMYSPDGLRKEYTNPISLDPKLKYSQIMASGKPRAKDRLEQPAALEWRQANYDSRLHLNNVVRTGEFIGIVGPSGSGKTTLLESAVGLILPNEGQLIVGGEQITKANLNILRRKIRLVLQEAGEYLIGRSVYHEIFYGESQQDLKVKNKERLAILENFGLPVCLADVAPERLSGGERQKVALAAALRTLPEILLLDEPLLGLDATSRVGIQTMISAWDMTILYVTHDLREVLQDADRIWLVENGSVVLDCSIQSWREHQEQFRAAGVRC
ncbi:ATP-binding cassette domain-containing protein [Desulfosporosinus sp. BG]|uniref:ABC transporter ATP-binding protein n=1 Tax=Desulfosporosinus sp. BG TaxID=1633135 RepID=UPI00083A2A44|nr:ATP-binding cassette domain-containing protein [Desulfosporosinus sp. BG]ODA42167.1 ATPase component BioM of energizing module of biotin ECF transporter [Desulfosporosinus sp. BG]